MSKQNIAAARASHRFPRNSVRSSIFTASRTLAESALPDEDLFDPNETNGKDIGKWVRCNETEYNHLFRPLLEFEIPDGLAEMEVVLSGVASRNERLASRMGGVIAGILVEMLRHFPECAEQPRFPGRCEGVLRGILRIARFAYFNTRLRDSSAPSYMKKLFGFVFPSSPSLAGFAFAERVLSCGVSDEIPCLKREHERVLGEFGRETDKAVESMRSDIVAGKISDSEASGFLADLANYRDGKLFSRVFCKFPSRLRTPSFFFGEEMIDVGGFLFAPGEVAFARNSRLKTTMEGKENFFGFSTLALFRGYDMSAVPDEIFGMVFPRERLDALGKMCARYGHKTVEPWTRRINEKFLVPGSEEDVSLADCMLSMRPAEIVARKYFWKNSLRRSVMSRRTGVSHDGLTHVSQTAFDAFLASSGKEYAESLQEVFSDEEARTITLDDKFSCSVCFDPRPAFFTYRLDAVADIPNAWFGTRGEMRKCRTDYREKFSVVNLFHEAFSGECANREKTRRKKLDSIRDKLFSSENIWREIEYRMKHTNSRGEADALCAAFLEACFGSDRRVEGYALSPEKIPDEILSSEFSSGEFGGKTVARYLVDNMMIPASAEILLLPVSKKCLKAPAGSLYIDVFLETAFMLSTWGFLSGDSVRDKEKVSSVVCEVIFTLMRDRRFWSAPKKENLLKRRGELVGFVLKALPRNVPHARTSCVFTKNRKGISLLTPGWMRHEDVRTFILGECLLGMTDMGMDESSVPMVEAMLRAWGWGTKNMSVESESVESGAVYYSVSSCRHYNFMSVEGTEISRDAYGGEVSKKRSVAFSLSYPYGFHAYDEKEASQSPERMFKKLFENVKRFAEWAEHFLEAGKRNEERCA